MSKIAVRLNRMAAAFHHEVARCESSGSEHSPAESSFLLSDLVNSFLESTEESREDVAGDGDGDGELIIGDKKVTSTRGDGYECTEDTLQSLLLTAFHPANTKIHAAVEEAVREVGICSPVDYKRRLMTRLRHRGFDAGLCKSKWEKTINIHSLPGYHEYIDVMLEGSRYIVEVSISKEFEIARATDFYAELLHHFPPIFVGQQDELRKIVRMMCKSMKKSMKQTGMKVPPWRRSAYMNAKWFNSYKRTTNEVAAILHKATSCLDDEGLINRHKTVGFVTGPAAVSYICCRPEGFIATGGRKVGNLAAALQDDTFTILKI